MHYFLLCLFFFSKIAISKESYSHKQTLQIHLPNGLEALLISDPSFTESSASLSVEAGSWDDPQEHPGMAHFVEHLLFLGSRAYPEENDFSRYILERGGEYNACTRWDKTVYGFSIPKSFFLGALKRFSQLFIDPLFTSSAIQREMHSVHHEFEDSIEDDSLRLWRVLKESGNPDHVNRKLSCGNLKTLSQVRQIDIQKWFKRYYNPKSMKLVLMSSEPLEILETYAIDCFSQISSCNEEEIVKAKREKITSLDQRGSFIYLKPALKNRSLFLIWEITQANSQGVELLQFALNSLVQILEKQPYVQETGIEFWKITRDQGLFILNTVLTNEGLGHYEKVISTCFQVLNSLKQIGISQNLLKKSRDSCSFESTLDCVMKISSDWIDDKIESKSSLLEQAEANSLLSALDPFECIYALVASPEELGIKLSRIEKWMGSSYTIRRISDSKLEEWRKETPYALTGFNREEKEASIDQVESEVEEKDPILLIENELGSIFWIESSLKKKPFLDAFFFIERPSLYSFTKEAALNKIFALRCREVLDKEFNQEESMFRNLETEGSNLSIFTRVPKEEFHTHFQRFFSLLKNINTSKGEFEKSKKDLLSFYFEDPPLLKYAEEILDSLVHPAYPTQLDLYNTLLLVDFEEYKAFEKGYFNELFIEAVILGGESREPILEVWQEVLSVINAKPHSREKGCPSSCSEFKNRTLLYKTHQRGNALLLLIEGGETTKDLEAMYQVLTVLLRTEFFNELRTKQQIAYQVDTWGHTLESKSCLYFSIRSSTHAPKDLLYRVENFLENFANRAQRLLSFERFETIRDALIAQEKNEDVLVSLQSLTYEKVLEEISTVFSKNKSRRIAVLIEGSSIP